MHPQPGTAAYTAAKAGLLAFTRALALEWAPKVRVNHVTAGPMPTAYGEEGGAAIDGLIPMGRTAVPPDVATPAFSWPATWRPT